ncbi:hypothetical protein C2G38_2214782 [Gigaspora rosea]|uniref:Uncharacterized protein n=1 Tax=Gigaspora rosea TaxID=44941 RepID=A0A397UE14_9GLOM|nr:hypothetical protein C2G38_2214782 [Gigaspora rosea]
MDERAQELFDKNKKARFFFVFYESMVACHSTNGARSARIAENIIMVPNNDDKNNMYYTAINTVENIQKRDEYAHNDPLWWGILDFRDDNISPCPDSLRAENFLSEGEINRFINALKGAINEEKEKISKSAESFIEALLLSDIISIYQLSKVFGTYGVSGLCNLLQKSAEEMQDGEKKIIQDHLVNIDVYDDATIYVGRCIQDTGENRTDADREDKANRSGINCVGKACHFLYWNSSRESGVGENYGPMHKDNHDKSVTDFMEIIKVAKSQHKKLQNYIIEQCGNQFLPGNLQNRLEPIFIPFFQIIGIKIKFYLLFQINGDLYGIWDWTSEMLPTKDEDIGEVVLLCKTFLVHSNLVARVGRITNLLIKKTEVEKFRSPEEFTQNP